MEFSISASQERNSPAAGAEELKNEEELRPRTETGHSQAG
jgi:hypothetical protein